MPQASSTLSSPHHSQPAWTAIRCSCMNCHGTNEWISTHPAATQSPECSSDSSMYDLPLLSQPAPPRSLLHNLIHPTLYGYAVGFFELIRILIAVPLYLAPNIFTWCNGQRIAVSAPENLDFRKCFKQPKKLLGLLGSIRMYAMMFLFEFADDVMRS